MAGLYLFGYVPAIPAFMAAYFLWADPLGWKMALGSAIVMGGLTYFGFVQARGLSLPGGQLFVWLR